MKVAIDHIIICKTNIRTDLERQKVKDCLDNHPEILQWNIDQQDIDCVLRVISTTLDETAVITLIQQHGFDCAELD